MCKVDDGEKRKKQKKQKKKRMSFVVATNVVASWLLDRRSTGMPHASVNNTIPRVCG